MAAAAATEKESTTCSQCEQHLAEIERLRAELSKLQGDNVQRQSAKWSCLAALGVFLLATTPFLPLAALQVLENAGWTNSEWFAYIFWGVSIGLPWAQWSLLGTICMLHHGPLWQRALIWVGLAGCTGMAMLLAITVLENDPEDVLIVGWAAPLLAVVIIFPTFMARVLRRWTLAERNAKAVPRPVSLKSYLALMAVLGIVFTAAKFFPWRIMASDAEEVAIYLVLFGGPLMAMSFAHVWLLPTILRTREAYSPSWIQWLLAPLVLATTTAASVGGFMVVAPQAVQPDELWLIAGLIASVPCAGTLLIAGGYFWLRMLGYELLTSRQT